MVKPSSVFPVAIAGAAFLYLSSSSASYCFFLFIQKQLMWDDGLRIRRYCVHPGLCEDMKLFMEDSPKK